MKSYNLILASGSPRRRELLSQIKGVNFSVEPADIDESVDMSLPPCELVCFLAKKKALHVLKNHPNAKVLGADTVVVFKNQILGKPSSFNEAFNYFKILCSNTHYVYTGVCVASIAQVVTNYDKTAVTFSDFDESIITEYINSGKCFDKAGGYGLQDEEMKRVVTKVDGDITNVIGLPLKITNDLLLRS